MKEKVNACVKERERTGKCECGLPMDGHPRCGACTALLGYSHGNDVVSFRGQHLCRLCVSSWLTREKVEKHAITWKEFLSPSYGESEAGIIPSAWMPVIVPSAWTPVAIHALQEYYGWSQAELVRRLGCARSTFRRWVDGLHKPSGMMIRALNRVATNGENERCVKLGSKTRRWDEVSILALRKQCGWTQEVLADALGTKRGTVSLWERGRCIPFRLSFIKKLDELAEGRDISSSFGSKKRHNEMLDKLAGGGPLYITEAVDREWNQESIRAMRKRYLWTQGQLASRIGCRLATVWEWEQGRCKPQGMSILALNRIDNDGYHNKVDCEQCYAKCLSEVRKACGLTREELASFLFVNRGTIRLWESGGHTPPNPFFNLMYEMVLRLKGRK